MPEIRYYNLEKLKKSLTGLGRMSAAGADELILKRPLTNPKDREALLHFLEYLHWRFQAVLENTSGTGSGSGQQSERSRPTGAV